MKKHINVPQTLLLFAFLSLIFSGTALAGKDKTAPDPIKNDVISNQAMIDNLKSNLKEFGTSLNISSALAGEIINWQVIGSGATDGSSTNFQLLGTVGQTAIGKSSSVNYQISHGFWQNFTSGTCCDNPGDANDDGIVGISDLTYFVDYMFNSGSIPICQNEFDNNVDCILGISDLTYFVDYMFNGGSEPLCGCVE